MRLDKKRHADIIRLLAQRQREESSPTEHQTLLPGVLDGLNAFGYLEQTAKRATSDWLCFGPKSIAGKGWTGVVIWYREKTFHAYKTITILGTWAVADNETINVRVGTHALVYNGQPYNVEAYMFRMRTEFETYYNAIETPPEVHTCLYTTDYIPQNRLIIRQKLQMIFHDYWQT